MDSMSQIMTLSEVAEYLKVAEKTVSRMIARNEIPCAKIAGQWRFMRSMIDDWITSKMEVIPQNDLARLVESETELVPLSRLLDESYVLTDIQPGSKSDVLTQLVSPLVNSGVLNQEEDYLNKLLTREGMASTALGNGVAWPHIRQINQNSRRGPLVVTGLCPSGTDFQSHDGLPTKLFFLLLSDSEVVHLRLMSKISRLVQDTGLVDQLSGADDVQQFFGLLIKAESRLNLSSPQG